MSRTALAILLLLPLACTAPAKTQPVAPTSLSPVTYPRLLPARTAGRSRPLTPVGIGQYLQVTAYCPTGRPTASGVWPREGMAAGNRWSFGTRLLVEHVGIVTVTDRIGSGSQLDLFRTSCAAAIQFGRRILKVSTQP